MNYLYADLTASMTINGKQVTILNKDIINSLISNGVQFTCFSSEIQKNTYVSKSGKGKHTNIVSFVYIVTFPDGSEQVCLGLTSSYCQSVFGTYSASVFQAVKKHGNYNGIKVVKLFPDAVRRTKYANLRNEFGMQVAFEVHPQQLPAHSIAPQDSQSL